MAVEQQQKRYRRRRTNHITNQRMISMTAGWAFLCSACWPAATAREAITARTKNHCHQKLYSQRFVRIIDGGSTGSRLHTFEYLPNNRIATVGTSSHIDTPLSDYVHSTALQVKEHLLPLVLTDNDDDDDNDNNLSNNRLSDQRIPVYYGATAGMRLVEPHWQTALYDRVLSSLNEDARFSQHHAMIDVFTLSGTDEAYYAALAANYLAGYQGGSKDRLLGALDIGGASTQLVSPLSDENITKENFFAISLLGYGVDQFQKRLFATKPTPGTINPCLNAGYLPTAQGNATACAEWMHPLLADVTGLIATDISTEREYWAMSLFYFSFDALRHFTADPAVQMAWPTPTLSQLRKAGETLCSMPWSELKQQQSSHKYTRNDNDLSKRCFEAVYLVELLTAMKFTDQHVIQYMLYTESGDEVEWTLGMAMALRDIITQECLDDTDDATTATSVDLDKEECVNRADNKQNNITANAAWARLLSSVLSADDIFSR